MTGNKVSGKLARFLLPGPLYSNKQGVERDTNAQDAAGPLSAKSLSDSCGGTFLDFLKSIDD